MNYINPHIQLILGPCVEREWKFNASVCIYTYAENWNTLLQDVCTSVNRELEMKWEERITLQNETNKPTPSAQGRI